jgi:hypothetical protein
MGVAANNQSKLGYVVFQLFWLVMTIILVFCTEAISGWMEGGPGLSYCEQDEDGNAPLSCYGASAFARISFSLAIFHLVMLLISAARTKMAADFLDGCWCLKVLLVMGLFIVSFWIPNDPFFLSFYMNAACVLSLIFLAFQALYILVCCILVNERLVKNTENQTEASCSQIILLVFFVLTTGANITWIVFLFINFGSLDCISNLVLLSITAFACLIMQGIVCLGLRQDASIFTSSLVTLYCLFLQWSALSSHPDETCNPHAASSGNATLRLSLNLLITFIAMFTAAATVEDELPAPISTTENKSDAIQEPFLDNSKVDADKEKGENGETNN